MAETPKGYDYEPISGGRYINLKQKGDTALMRIVSLPKRAIKHWVAIQGSKKKPINCIAPSKAEQTEATKAGKRLPNVCPYCGDDVPRDERVKKTEVFGWIAIDREDGQVKIFKAPRTVYEDVMNLVADVEDWGAPPEGFPLQYDIKVERTEEPGKGYYKVTPKRVNFGPLTDAEKAAVEDFDVDLLADLKDERQADGERKAGAEELETAPGDKVELPTEQEEAPADVDEDDVPF